MTLSPRRSARITALARASLHCAIGFALIGSNSSAIAADGVYYEAKLAAPASEDRTIADGVAWSCQGKTCIARKGSARALRVCRALARKFGEVASFTVKGESLPPHELSKCNGQ